MVKGCRTNYARTKAEKQNEEIERVSIRTFGFPHKTRHSEERKRWIESIPFMPEYKIACMKCPVICEKHWPAGFAEKKGDRGRLRPVDPPSIFESVNEKRVFDFFFDVLGRSM